MSNKQSQKVTSRLNHKIEKVAEENARYYSDTFNKFKLFILNNIDSYFDENINFEYNLFVRHYNISDIISYEGKGLDCGSFLRKKINMMGMRFEKFIYLWTKIALKDIKRFKVAKPVLTLNDTYYITISLDMNADNQSSESSDE